MISGAKDARARNAYTRGIEHVECMGNREERSALWNHCVDKHEAEQQEFKMSVPGVYGNDAVLRQISESARINKIPSDFLMNSGRNGITSTCHD